MTIKASRLSGIVPFATWFEGEPGPKYEWDFGDPDSGSNTSGGYRAAHIWTKPGAYTVRVLVDGREQTFPITVTEYDAAPSEERK